MSSFSEPTIEMKEMGKKKRKVSDPIEGTVYIFGVVRLEKRAIMTHIVPIEKGTANWRRKKKMKEKEYNRLRRMISAENFEKKVKSKQVREEMPICRTCHDDASSAPSPSLLCRPHFISLSRLDIEFVLHMCVCAPMPRARDSYPISISMDTHNVKCIAAVGKDCSFIVFADSDDFCYCAVTGRYVQHQKVFAMLRDLQTLFEPFKADASSAKENEFKKTTKKDMKALISRHHKTQFYSRKNTGGGSGTIATKCCCCWCCC